MTSSLTRGAFLLLMMQVLLTVAFVSKSSNKPEITNLHQTDQTLTTVTIKWNIDTSREVPLKYAITVNDLLTNEFVCTEAHCSYTVDGLDPCEEIHLHLVAIYDDGTSNSGADLQAHTAFEVPETVTNLHAMEDTVSWTAPTNANCVHHYRVCYASSTTGVHQCFETVDLSFSLLSFSGCDKMEVTVKAVSGDGKNGPVSTINVVTPYREPSEPTNMSATTLSDVAITVVWDAPDLNPECVDHNKYRITFGEVEAKLVEQQGAQYSNKGRGSSNNPEFVAILTPMWPCTNYLISVLAVSITNQESAPAKDTATTEYAAPGALPDVVVVGGDGHITVRWGDVINMHCLDSIEICYSDSETPCQVCVQVPDIGSGSFIIQGLHNCRTYSIVVVGVSVIGQLGQPITVAVDTNDAAPGPVLNLMIDSITTNSITISYDEPRTNTGCADKYTVSHKDITISKTMHQQHTPVRSNVHVTEPLLSGHYKETIDDLEPCGLYEIEVYASSKSNYKGEIRRLNGEVNEVLPERPIDATFVTATTSSITITWFAPAFRYCVDNYHTYFTAAGTTNAYTYKVNVNNYDLQFLETFVPLSHCSTYNVTMTAVSNAKGESQELVIGQYDTLC